MGARLIGMPPAEVRHALADDDAPDRTPELSRALPGPMLAQDRVVHTRRQPSETRRYVAEGRRASGPLGAPGAVSRAALLAPPPRPRPRGMAWYGAAVTPARAACTGGTSACATPGCRQGSRVQRLAVVQERGERRWAEELYRLKGELLLRQATGMGLRPVPTEAAEACFRQTIRTARRHRAKSLKLQAVMRLSRLWQQQGKHEEARRLLGEI